MCLLVLQPVQRGHKARRCTHLLRSQGLISPRLELRVSSNRHYAVRDVVLLKQSCEDAGSEQSVLTSTPARCAPEHSQCQQTRRRRRRRILRRPCAGRATRSSCTRRHRSSGTAASLGPAGRGGALVCRVLSVGVLSGCPGVDFGPPPVSPTLNESEERVASGCIDRVRQIRCTWASRGRTMRGELPGLVPVNQRLLRHLFTGVRRSRLGHGGHTRARGRGGEDGVGYAEVPRATPYAGRRLRTRRGSRGKR